MANNLKLYEVRIFSMSPNSCQCTTVLNTDVPSSLHNAYITYRVGQLKWGQLTIFAGSIWMRR